MRNLFDLLDASSDEDADELKKAFRKAVGARRDAQAQQDALIRASAVPRDTPSRRREFERQPLYEPDRRLSCIRLSDKTSHLHPRHVAAERGQAYEPEVPVEVRGG